MGLLYGCASVATLNGGPKDVTPPQIIQLIPSMGDTAVASKEIQICFDEYFSLNSPTDSILITPVPVRQPDYIIKGKKLIIKLKDSLKSNTTYHIDLMGAVRDITENNTLPPTRLIFSTGSTVDSMGLGGKVVDAYTMEAVSKACVFLYGDADDSAIYRGPGEFFTLTDNKGHFSFENIPDKPYRLLALTDKNYNRIWDQTDESIAFWNDNSPIRPMVMQTDSNGRHIFPDSTDFLLRVFQEKDSNFRLLSYRTLNPGCHSFVFSLSVDSFLLKPLEGENLPYLECWDKEKDSCRIYVTDTARNKTEWFELWANGLLMDTVSLIPFGLSKNSKDTKGNTQKNILSSRFDRNVEIGEKFTIVFDYPLKSIEKSAFRLQVSKDKDTSDITDFDLKISYDSLLLLYPLHSRSTYVLQIADSACLAYNGKYSDSIRAEFSMRGKKEYGQLLLHLQFPKSQDYILQLLKEDQTVAYEQRLTVGDENKSDLRFSHLKEGKYHLRIIADANGNSRWDEGKYAYRRQAEAVFCSPQKWEVKKNWIIEENIVIDFK